jgi:transcriptional regulator with XRE-family HTH domain
MSDGYVPWICAPPKWGVDTSSVIFADTLRSRRAELRLNQRDLAAQLGVKQQTVSRWESGTALPRPDRVAQLAKALGFNRGDLLRLAGYIGEGDDVEKGMGAMLPMLSDLADDDLRQVLDAAWKEHCRRTGADNSNAPWKN